MMKRKNLIYIFLIGMMFVASLVGCSENEKEDSSFDSSKESYNLTEEQEDTVESVIETEALTEEDSESEETIQDSTVSIDTTIAQETEAEKTTVTETIHQHQYVASVTKEATCKEKGTRTFTCSLCGDSYEEQIPIDSNSHKYEETTVAAKCDEDGYINKKCLVCGKEETETLTKLGHHYMITSEKSATCLEKGVKVFTCDRCGDSYREESAALGHSVASGNSFATCWRCQGLVWDQGYTFYVDGAFPQYSESTHYPVGSDGYYKIRVTHFSVEGLSSPARIYFLINAELLEGKIENDYLKSPAYVGYQLTTSNGRVLYSADDRVIFKANEYMGLSHLTGGGLGISIYMEDLRRDAGGETVFHVRLINGY